MTEESSSTELGDVSSARWAVVAACISIAVGVLLLAASGFVAATVGLVAGSIIPAVALGLHNQRAQLRSVILGEYLSTAFTATRAVVLVFTVVLAGAHGYRFALALESWALS